jgi:hypothetical protein
MEPEKLLPSGELIPQNRAPIAPIAPIITPPHGVPSPAAQSWGTVISIIVIVLMIIIGAFYAWGQRIAQDQAFITPTTTQ